jgi:hypothetical protein
MSSSKSEHIAGAGAPAPVSLRYVFGMVITLLGFSMLFFLLIVAVDHQTDNVAAILTAAMSPASGIVGLLLGHHLGRTK